jgi:membrane-associated phospholipid phosphatase
MLITATMLLSLAVAPDGPSSFTENETVIADTEQLPTTAANQDPKEQDRKEASERQEPSQRDKPATPPHTGVLALLDGLKEDVKDLPSKPNLYLALMGGGVALGVHPFDETFNVRLRSHYDAVNTAFAPAKYYGGTPEQVALSLGAYAFGRIFQQPKVSHLGMDLLRAQAISELLVQPVKFATGRRRPDGSDNRSFPSGHAAATFAAATVIERHLGWKRAALAYAIASYVAASRLHDNVHYLSDVAMGAAVGTIAGRTVTEHGRETWTLTPAVVPGGLALVIMRNP